MRPTREWSAKRCESAIGKRCTCVCGGRFHGARRIPRDAPRAEFEHLPESDPHHIEPKPKNGRVAAEGIA